MTEPIDRCGYTWPEDHKVDHDPNRQSCCWREAVDDSEYCIWHADPHQVAKSVEELEEKCAPLEIREQNRPVAELLDGAQLPGLSFQNTISFQDVSLRGSDFTDADLTNAELAGAEFTSADFVNSDLTGANLPGINLTDANFRHANLTSTFFGGANLSRAHLFDANLTGAYLTATNLTEANLSLADLTDAHLPYANLTGVTMERAVCVRTNLFVANLTGSKPHGATLTDVQINHDTEIRSVNQRKQEARWWQRGMLFPPQWCGYDPAVASEHQDIKLNQLAKAADTYQSFEKLARENARPSLQSEMFVLRQDMQRKRHWHNRDYFEWGFAQLSRTVFKYGESLVRIITVAVAVIVAYAVIYSQFDLIRDAGNQFVTEPVDALYFSTLTFTTLGLGDFQPEPTSQAARLLVTSQAASGAILIAIFVFVLGRRAAR